jgi:transposase
VAILEDGEIKRQLRIDLIRHRVLEFAETLRHDDEVVVEATGNSAAVERLLRPYVKRVAIANSRLVRAIAYARVKTDKIDATILAKLYAAGSPRGLGGRRGDLASPSAECRADGCG